MKSFWRRLSKNHLSTEDNETRIENNSENYRRIINTLYKKAINFYGKDNFIIKANNLGVLDMINEEDNSKKLMALERIIYNDKNVSPAENITDERIENLQQKLAELWADRSLEKSFQRQIAFKMEEKQQEYIKEIKKEIVSGRKTVDNAKTLKRLARLEKMETRSLNRTTLELVRPRNLDELVGQEAAVKALVSKIASPYPQHIIIYGPPGVGKTTAARLALEQARKRKNTPFYDDSRFVEIDGTTLRWDPREVTNPLLGSVHDPIYQGARSSLASEGIPEPRTGLVTEAHGGVLFIDEIGELDSMLQNKLLKVMEDKRVTFESSYYDESNEKVPQYIKKLFKDGAPADFILIGATTRKPEEINPAFRSRCGEVFFNPLSKNDIIKIVKNAGEKLSVSVEEEIAEIISNYTIEGRTAINLLIDAYSLALYEKKKGKKGLIISKGTLNRAIQNRRMAPNNRIDIDNEGKIGKIYGLGVSGFIGTVIEIEAVAFPAEKKGHGTIRFNESAGSMTKDSLFNAAVVVRKITGKRISDYDLHVNIVGGGKVDGPSAGIAIMLAIISAVEKIPLRQDIAVTGEVSIQGSVKPVGGTREKIHAAEQAGIKNILIPHDNINDINHKDRFKVSPIITVNDALKKALLNENKIKKLSNVIEL
ncbi:MAG: Lon family ATP-dependent protease [Bacillota bacterium]